MTLCLLFAVWVWFVQISVQCGLKLTTGRQIIHGIRGPMCRSRIKPHAQARCMTDMAIVDPVRFSSIGRVLQPLRKCVQFVGHASRCGFVIGVKALLGSACIPSAHRHATGFVAGWTAVACPVLCRRGRRIKTCVHKTRGFGLSKTRRGRLQVGCSCWTGDRGGRATVATTTLRLSAEPCSLCSGTRTRRTTWSGTGGNAGC